MAKYINKDALVAEIERLISNGQTKLKESEECNDYESYVALAERIATCINVLSILDTLEVKEVQEEPVSEELEDFAKRQADEFAEREYEGGSYDRGCLSKGYYWGCNAGAKWQKGLSKDLKLKNKE